MTGLPATGAKHAELMGGNVQRRFRLRRFAVQDFGCALTCLFDHAGSSLGPFGVLDVSTAGLAVAVAANLALAPGTALPGLRLLYGKETIHQGDGVVVYQSDGLVPRMGVRLTSGLLDLQSLWLTDRYVESRLARDLATLNGYRDQLPDTWRAAVADLSQCLQNARELLQSAQSSVEDDQWWQQAPDERALIQRIYRRWGPQYHELIRTLEHLSAELPPDACELARGYATRLLMPALSAGPMHHRAYHKPRGYAGDYRLMTMYFAQQLQGDSWWARFLHHVAQHYSLGRTVVARTQTMQDVIATTISAGKSRVCSLACGAAIEVERYLAQAKAVHGRIELTLIDQDEEALEYSHGRLTQTLAARATPMPVMLQPLHASVRQLLKPRTDDERALLAEVIAGQDLIYSGGLLDYLPEKIARALIRGVYRLLGPGGRLFIGNLRRVPDTSWIMDNVLAWHLEYRDEAAMLALATDLQPEPASVTVRKDATGHCLFLDVRMR